MSTSGLRDFRPKIHFTAPSAWINDPCGLVFYEGKYHLFYQHYPHDGIWGPMHWGHAISENLIDWEHLPIALYPDDKGTIYTGSAVADINNISGFGENDKVPLVAFYTNSGEKQEQHIAYSLNGIDFIKYENNPVIPNPGIKDFRDPNMFWNPVRNCWSMVIAAGDRVMFYATKDLRSWEKTGEFGVTENLVGGIWEVPDMVPLEFEGKTVWLLIASMIPEKDGPHVSMQYFLGDFDGDKFINSIPFDYAEQLDCGWDNYAGFTFNNVEAPIYIGWGNCWQYAAKTPTGEYTGNMTLPRHLAIKSTPVGLRLAAKPIIPDNIIGDNNTLETNSVLNSETFILKIEGEGACSIRIENEGGQYLVFGVDIDNYLYYDRTNAGATDFCEHFASEKFSVRKVKRFFEAAYSIEFIFDVSMSELFIDDGTRSMAMLCYPDTPYNSIDIEGDIKVTYCNINR